MADLPDATLATTTIEGVDSDGLPRAATVLVDSTAAGIGWHIDQTQTVDAVFDKQLSSTAFEASPTSPAWQRYDLLTIMTHELGHAFGIHPKIDAFDRNIVEVEGNYYFVMDQSMVRLSEDRVHFDNTHAYSLMNTHFDPGMRLLPGELEFAVMEAIHRPNSLWAPRRQQPNQDQQQRIAKSEAVESSPILNKKDSPIAVAKSPIRIEEIVGQPTSITRTELVPNNAESLTFTVAAYDLNGTTGAPPDAFEAALNVSEQRLFAIDSLLLTDALLNLQANQSLHVGPGVTALDGSELTVTQRNPSCDCIY